MKAPIVVALAGWLAFTAPDARAQEHLHDAEAGDVTGDVGVVHFDNSGARAAQPAFLRGLALLHDFEYVAARKSFRAAEAADPHFAMAVWGEALTFNHTLWNEQDTASARVVLAKLGATPAERIAKGGTARERAYLAALEKLYGPGTKAARNTAYSEALRELSLAYPGDLDAKALYALSIMGVSPVRDVARYMRAAAVAEEIYQEDRRHPGALHYLIHAYDDPVHAPLGLRAARLYADVAPAAAHAQHMTSHIFLALGMWDEAIKADARSLEIARSHGDPNYHSLLWLEYEDLQEDRREPASELLRSVTHDVATSPSKENRLRLAFARAIWLVETRGTPEADAAKPVDASGIRSIGYFATHDFARGIAAAQAGHLADAASALDALRARCDAAHVQAPGENPLWYDALTESELDASRILAAALDGAIRFYGSDHPGGLARVRQAVQSAEGMAFEYGPPWSAKPLDELLGELLLRDSQFTEAAKMFRKTLETYPNRRLAREALERAMTQGAGGRP